jgi:hypothetical protein
MMTSRETHLNRLAVQVSDLNELELDTFLGYLNGATARRILEISDRRRSLLKAQSSRLFRELSDGQELTSR